MEPDARIADVPPRDARMRIALFGQPRSGTTALFYALRKACAPDVRCLFEPTGYVAAPSDPWTGVLAKVLLNSAENVRGFLDFERKVLIVRDARDWLLSTILFLPQQLPEVYGNPRAVQEIVGLLRRKEGSPGSVSMVEILEAVLRVTPGWDLGTAEVLVREALDFALAFEGRLDDGLTVRYEDFVDGRVAPLERYLGLDLEPRVEVPRQHAHVPRTLGYGSWRAWFTEEDVRRFRPWLERYLGRYGDTRDWSLVEVERLEPSHGSGYVQSSVTRRLAGASAGAIPRSGSR